MSIQQHLVSCSKSWMLDDGTIFLCYGMRSSIYHLNEWIVPRSFFSFLGCGVLPADVRQRDTCGSITVVEIFINSIKCLWPVLLINYGGFEIITSAIRISQFPGGADGMTVKLAHSQS